MNSWESLKNGNVPRKFSEPEKFTHQVHKFMEGDHPARKRKEATDEDWSPKDDDPS